MPTSPSEDRLREVYNLIDPYIERRYGIPVVISDVVDPFTGDLDGAEIRVDHANSIEEAVFIIAHLFGHTVQWNVSAEAKALASITVQTPDEALLRQLAEYEREACRYSLQLFHDAGVFDLDQWLSDFSTCDLAYLMHFYRTGVKRPFREFWRDGAPRLEPLPIPEFHPTRWLARWDGVVI